MKKILSRGLTLHAGDGATLSGADEQSLSSDSSGKADSANPPRA